MHLVDVSETEIGDNDCKYVNCGEGTSYEFDANADWTIPCQRFSTDCIPDDGYGHE